MLKIIKRDLTHHIQGTLYANNCDITIRHYVLAWLAPEFRVVLIYRILHFLKNRGFHSLVFCLQQRTKRRYCIDISPEAIIGAGLRIAHPFDIVIGPNAELGSDCVVFNGVNVGNKYVGSGSMNIPIIGDRVILSTGSKILGKIVLGDDVIVGANAVVLKDVDSKEVVVGVPAVSK